MKKNNRIAAQWWGDQLRQPTVSTNIGINPQSSGDEVYGAMFMHIARNENRKQATEEQIHIFENRLCELLDHENSDLVYVDVEYAPDILLTDALETAKIPEFGAFPLKTTMLITDIDVKVRCGYGAPYITVEAQS